MREKIATGKYQLFLITYYIINQGSIGGSFKCLRLKHIALANYVCKYQDIHFKNSQIIHLKEKLMLKKLIKYLSSLMQAKVSWLWTPFTGFYKYDATHILYRGGFV